LHVKQYLESLNLTDSNNEEIKIDHDKAVKSDCSSKRRPDFLLKLPMHNIIVEVDEHAHEGYDSTCELTRLNNLYEDLGLMPLIMIRFNPDGFTSNGVKYKSCFTDNNVRKVNSKTHKYEDIKYRLEVLEKHIK